MHTPHLPKGLEGLGSGPGAALGWVTGPGPQLRPGPTSQMLWRAKCFKSTGPRGHQRRTWAQCLHRPGHLTSHALMAWERFYRWQMTLTKLGQQSKVPQLASDRDNTQTQDSSGHMGVPSISPKATHRYKGLYFLMCYLDKLCRTL